MIIDPLSPEELEGLLDQKKTGGKAMPENELSKVETEAITELLNVSLGGSAVVLTELLSEQVFVTAPSLVITKRDNVFASATAPFYVALGEYAGTVSGMQVLSISKTDTDALFKEEAEELEEEIEFQAVQEMIEKMFNSVAQSMSSLMEMDITHSLSGMDLVNQAEEFSLANFTKEQWFVETVFQLNVGSKKVHFHLCIPIPLARQLAGILTESFDEEEVEEIRNMPKQSDHQRNESTQAAPTVQNVQFSSFDNTESTQSEPNNLNMLLDIPLQVTVELGRTKRIVKEILEISQGSIIELDKLAGEPVDILVNNKLIAVGEVVVIDENFGVRVTDVLSTAERISKLR